MIVNLSSFGLQEKHTMKIDIGQLNNSEAQ